MSTLLPYAIDQLPWHSLATCQLRLIYYITTRDPILGIIICASMYSYGIKTLSDQSPSWCTYLTPLCHILLLNLDILQGSFRLCNWLSLRRLVSWINHLPPACWSTFRKSNSKQQLGCRFDIMDYESYFFVFWHMQLYMSWYIISFFGFTLLNILHFFQVLLY